MVIRLVTGYEGLVNRALKKWGRNKTGWVG
jgi:hypothetical protein